MGRKRSKEKTCSRFIFAYASDRENPEWDKKEVTGQAFTHNLLLCVLIGAEQIDSLHVAKVDVMAQQKDEQQFADILLLAVAIQRLVTFEFGADVGQLLVNTFDLCFLTLTWKKYEERENKMLGKG